MKHRRSTPKGLYPRVSTEGLIPPEGALTPPLEEIAGATEGLHREVTEGLTALWAEWRPLGRDPWV
jgi:hypothetical protein